jgi:UDP-N-acetylglucosamine--N-acetylmuramyl-(pentapeptide) pyrophosphoryl-undecaprenol N-acetylglucosamine transferase
MIVYIGQKGDSLSDIPAQDSNIDEVRLIRAGKLRRYHGEGWRQLLDVATMAKNLRDMAYTVIGLWQSFKLLREIKPAVIFVKGGFVGVPVGLAAAVQRIPYITHDSDALPGLANRIIAPWARKHAVALPKEVYSYPADKTETVGVPLAHHYRPFTKREMREARQQIGVPTDGKLVLVTGGGLGAHRLNQAVAACLEELLERYSDLTIVQIAGRNHEVALRQQYAKDLPSTLQKRVIVKGFITNMHLYSGAADVVVARAGATSMAELAAQKKPSIVVPNPLLAGGHQLKNAEVLSDRKACLLVSEDKLKLDDHALMPPLISLLDDPERARQLGERLGSLEAPDSAKRLAVLLLEEADSHQ